MGFSEDKTMIINTLSENKLNTIKNNKTKLN